MIRLIEVAPGVVPEYKNLLLDLELDFVFSKPGRFMFPQCENGTYRTVSRATDFLAAKFGLGIIVTDTYV